MKTINIDEDAANELTSIILDNYEDIIPDSITRKELFPHVLELVVTTATSLGKQADTLIKAELGINEK